MLKNLKSTETINELAKQLAEQAYDLSQEIKDAIYKYGTEKDDQGNEYFVYEVDGLGNKHFMDDANIPSLLSLPYLGFVDKNDPIYQNTRKRILSSNNPFYFEGSAAKGVGSPHTG